MLRRISPPCFLLSATGHAECISNNCDHSYFSNKLRCTKPVYKKGEAPCTVDSECADSQCCIIKALARPWYDPRSGFYATPTTCAKKGTPASDQLGGEPCKCDRECKVR